MKMARLIERRILTGLSWHENNAVWEVQDHKYAAVHSCSFYSRGDTEGCSLCSVYVLDWFYISTV